MTDRVRVLLLGDFRGEAAPAGPLAGRRIHRVDVDTLAAVLARIAPAVVPVVDGERCRVEPRSLEDFHPERLLRTLAPLVRSEQRRRRLADPQTFAAAVAEIEAAGSPAAEPSAPAVLAAEPAAGAADPDLFGRLLGGAAALPERVRAAAGNPALERLLQGAVAGHVVADAPRRTALVAAAEAALGDELRAVLHDPGFRALEASWRAVAWLVTRIDFDESLQLHLLDVGDAELDADAAADPSATALYARLAAAGRDAPDGTGWTLLADLRRYEGPDLGRLSGLAAVAAALRIPLIAGADAALARPDAPWAGAWRALRSGPSAPWLGLVASRLLLRLPYGASGEPLDGHGFEEVPDAALGAYPWGPGAIAVVDLAARAFAESGRFGPGADPEIDGLPACTRPNADGETELVPVAETWRREAELDALLDAGLMVLASHRQRATATLLGFGSIASPPSPLRGLPP